MFHPLSTRTLPVCVAIAAIATLVGCAAPPRAAHVTAATSAPPMKHYYKVAAVDAQGKPLGGVGVKVDFESKDSPVASQSCVTDESGSCPLMDYSVNQTASITSFPSFLSTAKARGTKDGYYPSTGQAVSTSGSQYGSLNGIRDLKLRMIAPTDYLADGFATSTTDRDLRERVLRFIDVIRMQSILVDSEVMLKGIGTSEFKGKKYLRLRVDSTTTFNSLKLNKYDMGKRLFDDTVRKVLSPLNDNIAAPKAYYGYDIVVYGHTKSFGDKEAVAEKVEYRFLLPEAAVRRYKDKDISGQALLDAGVELMDDERVEFKLQ